MLIFTTIVVKITNPKSGLNLIANSSSPVLSAPSFYSTGARRYPLSYVISGRYFWNEGRLYGQGNDGDVQFMSSTSISDTQGSFLVIYGSVLDTQRSSNKLHGINLRSTIARRYPLSYVIAGFYRWHEGSLGGIQDGYSYWWASTTLDASAAKALYIVIYSTLAPQNGGSKLLGFPLCCVSHSMLYPSVSAFVCILRSLPLEFW